MQTFLPHPDFAETARSLDWRRLGKQRVEAQQILNALANGGGWSNHPAVKMWRGYEDALRLYRNTIIEEWVRRGYRNNMPLAAVPDDVALPPWLGDSEFHASHRARLLAKDPEFYGRHGWTEAPADQGYLWPEVTDGEVTWRDLRAA
jgi:hypothetical protein